MSATTTATATKADGASSMPLYIKPTPVWTPLPIEGDIPAPFTTEKFGLKVIPLHPTFGCELQGVDWSKPVSPELYKEIREICDKVCVTSYVYLSPLTLTLVRRYCMPKDWLDRRGSH